MMTTEEKIALVLADGFGPLSDADTAFLEHLSAMPPAQAHAAAGRELVKGQEDLLRFALTSPEATASIVRLLVGTVELLADVIEQSAAKVH